jgi:hypothetical protein
MIDRTTRWLEVATLTDISAKTCAEVFLATWVARYGVPNTVTTDRGTQFTSEAWSELCKNLGMDHVKTTAYHPQENGLVERVHRQLKDALRAREAGFEWPLHLPYVLLGLRAAPKEKSGVSSAEAVFGQPLVLPGEVKDTLEENPLDFKNRLASEDPPQIVQPRTYADVAAGHKEPSLQEAKMVYVRRGGQGPPLASCFIGPFRVLQPGDKFFIVDIGGRQESISIDRLKPHKGLYPVDPASVPKRGRPKKISASP